MYHSFALNCLLLLLYHEILDNIQRIIGNVNEPHLASQLQRRPYLVPFMI